KEKIIKVSRERYTTPREVVEEKISRWTSADRNEGEDDSRRESSGLPRPSLPRPAIVEKPAASKEIHQEEKPKEERAKKDVNASALPHSAICDVCGEGTSLSFKPDPTRPVYCKDCLKKVRAGEIPRLEAKAPKPEKKEQEKEATPSFAAMPVDTGPAISLSQALAQGAQKFKG
ncbi:MAG: hypothetical protein Q8L21_00235, partial [Candidatus Komeilibacteria bacterium]|nr:hypothetical protein [Candidatus Komeilibacteria bacterium]